MNNEKNKKLIGNVINLISSDSGNMDMGFVFMHFFYLYPILIIGCVYMIVRELEIEALWASPLVVLFIFLNIIFSKYDIKAK